MYVKYGDYQFDDDAVWYAYTCPAKLDSNGVPYAYSPQYKLSGWISITDTGTVAGNQAAMTAKLALFEAAFAKQFQNFGFYDNAGNLTVHKLINAQTLGGVKVLTRPEYPDSRGAEYSTFRSFTLTLGADVPLSAQQGPNAVVEWQETLTYIGTGGPRRVWQEFIEDNPENQVVAQRTTIKAIQRGSAIGFGDYIAFPAPLYPLEVEHEDQRIFERGTPQAKGAGVFKYYPSSWSYFFEFANPQFGNPTGRPV